MNLTPQESRVREPEDSIPIQTLETVTVSESPQNTRNCKSSAKGKSAHPECVALWRDEVTMHQHSFIVQHFRDSGTTG